MASSDKNVSSSIELGEIDCDATDREIQTSTSKRKLYTKYSADERFKIGKYASENGPIAAVRKFEKQFPNMNESTARTFKKKCESELDGTKRQGRAKPTSISLKPQDRPLLLGELDGLVQEYILAASNRGNVISRNIAVSAAKVIMERYPRLIGSVDIESSHWAQSLFHRMGFRRRQATTSKLEIPEGVLKKIKMLFHHDIVTKVAKFNIPDSLINLDQTPTKYVPVGRTTLAKKNSKAVTIKGFTGKRTITATFAISIRGDFLPMQLIYGGKTKKCLPRFKFPEKFSLSYNETHSNEKACKFIEEILKPYIKQVIERDNLPIDQTALVIMDVFKGQVTPVVLDLYKESNIVVVLVPANMTNHLQPLDLTVNGYVKRFMRAKFNSWYSSQLRRQLDEGKQLQDIDVYQYQRLSILKPFHAEWLVDCYNHMTTTAERNIILSGWKSAGIMEALQTGTDGLKSLDPFHDIGPLIEQEGERNLIFSATANQIAGDSRQFWWRRV